MLYVTIHLFPFQFYHKRANEGNVRFVVYCLCAHNHNAQSGIRAL